MSFSDTIMSWLICLVPRFVCRWLWYRSERTGKRLGLWAPHILCKMIGAETISIRTIEVTPELAKKIADQEYSIEEIEKEVDEKD